MLKNVVLLLIAPCTVIADWKPPTNPDPHTILNEAEEDAQDGRYEDALAKHLWVHNHSLDVRESFYGVRLSFALSSWHELGKQYEPALEKLKEARDDAYKQVLEKKKNVFHLFKDFQSINEKLGEEDQTVAAFIRLDKENTEKAKEVYRTAQPDLIRAKEYKLCGKYLDHGWSFPQMVKMYEVNMEFASEKEQVELKRLSLQFAENRFLNDSATLITLLVLNDRKPEAEKIAQKVKEKSKHEKRDEIIDAALEGTPPKEDRKR